MMTAVPVWHLRRSSRARTRMDPAVVVTQERTPADRRTARQGVRTRTNRMHALESPVRRTPQPRPDQPPAPQSSSSWTSTGRTVEVTSPSVVVKPQKVLSHHRWQRPFLFCGWISGESHSCTTLHRFAAQGECIMSQICILSRPCFWMWKPSLIG